MTDKNFLWWFLLGATIPSFISLLKAGYFPMHDDLPVVRQFAMEQCLKDGQIPCRWTKELGYGYGYPLLNFYPPLPYIVGQVPRLMGLSLIDTTKLLFILSFVLSAGFMARLGSLFLGRWGGIAAGLFYLYGPYHAVDLYVRGDLNELWAIAFFPAVLWASFKLIKKPTIKSLVILALSFVGIALSHVGMMLIMTPALGLWCLLWLIINRKNELSKRLKYLFISGLLTTGLTSFFLFPVIFEQQFVHVETLTQGYFNFLAHFVDLKQLFLSRFWGYGASVYGPDDGLSFQIGIIHWAVAALGLFGFLRWRQQNPRLIFTSLFFWGIFLGSAFLSHWKATPIWLHLPKLEFLQFPWRFLALVLPAVSFLAAAAFSLIPLRLRSFSLILLFLILIGSYGSYFLPQTWWPDRTDALQFTGKTWQKAITAGIFDYLPKWSKMPPGSPAPNDAMLKGRGVVATLFKSSNRQQYLVDNLSGGTVNLQVNTLYYPGWTAAIGNQPTKINIFGPTQLGLINVTMPKGRNVLNLRFSETPLRKFSNLLSLLSWLFLGIYLLSKISLGSKSLQRFK